MVLHVSPGSKATFTRVSSNCGCTHMLKDAFFDKFAKSKVEKSFGLRRLELGNIWPQIIRVVVKLHCLMWRLMGLKLVCSGDLFEESSSD